MLLKQTKRIVVSFLLACQRRYCFCIIFISVRALAPAAPLIEVTFLDLAQEIDQHFCAAAICQWHLLLSPPAAESYSVACSEGSIAPSAGSLPHQASGSTGPCSHSPSGASRHPVSALKKWLTNPVRKLSSDPRGGTGKAEKQSFKAEGKQKPFLHSETRQSSLEVHNNYTILSSENTVRTWWLNMETPPLHIFFVFTASNAAHFVCRTGKVPQRRLRPWCPVRATYVTFWMTHTAQ